MNCFLPSTNIKNNSKDIMHGRANGYAVIYDNDMALARDRAVDSAMNTLIKEKLGADVSGLSVVQDFQLVETIIEAKSRGLVIDWNIISESIEGNTVLVLLEGTVVPSAVNESVRWAIENYGRPRFMILMDETIEDKKSQSGITITETNMIDFMKKLGFDFVDAGLSAKIIASEKEIVRKAMAAEINENVQNVLLDYAGAEVIIVGSTTVSDQSGTLDKYKTNIQSKQAVINLKAIDVYNGRVIASVSYNSPGAHVDSLTATKTCIQRCLFNPNVLGMINNDGKIESGKFINQIAEQFLISATQRIIRLNVSGLDYSQTEKFRDELKNRIRGISRVGESNFINNNAIIEVQFAGKTSDLANELLGKSEMMNLKITIKEKYPNKIIMAVSKR